MKKIIKFSKFFIVAIMLLTYTDASAWKIIKKRGQTVSGGNATYKKVIQSEERGLLKCTGPGSESCVFFHVPADDGGSILYDADEITQVNWGHNYIYNHFIISLGQLSGSYTWANQNSQGVLVTYHSTWRVIIDDEGEEAYEIIINKI